MAEELEHHGHEAPEKKPDPVEKSTLKATKHGNKIAIIGILVGIGVAIYLYIKNKNSSSSSSGTLPGSTIPISTGNGSGGGSGSGPQGPQGPPGPPGPPGTPPGTTGTGTPAKGIAATGPFLPSTLPSPEGQLLHRTNPGVTTGSGHSAITANVAATSAPQTRYAAGVTSALAKTGLSQKVIASIATSPPSNPAVGTVQPSAAQLSNPNVQKVARNLASQPSQQQAPIQADIVATAAVNPNIARSEAQNLANEQGQKVTINGRTYANQAIANEYTHQTHHKTAARTAQGRNYKVR